MDDAVRDDPAAAVADDERELLAEIHLATSEEEAINALRRHFRKVSDEQVRKLHDEAKRTGSFGLINFRMAGLRHPVLNQIRWQRVRRLGFQVLHERYQQIGKPNQTAKPVTTNPAKDITRNWGRVFSFESKLKR